MVRHWSFFTLFLIFLTRYIYIRAHIHIEIVQHIMLQKHGTKLFSREKFYSFLYNSCINESTKGYDPLAKYNFFDPPNLVKRTSALIITTKIMYEIGLSPEQLSV